MNIYLQQPPLPEQQPPVFSPLVKIFLMKLVKENFCLIFFDWHLGQTNFSLLPSSFSRMVA